MSDDDKAFIAGAVASTLYLSAVFVGGIATHVKAAWVAALISIACCYGTAMIGQMNTRPITIVSVISLFVASILAGGLAGFCLLIGG